MVETRNMQAEEFAKARDKQPKQPTLKSLYFKGVFGEAFIEAARVELPFLWGRVNLLEEFYSECAPGFTDRARRLHDQIGTPVRYRRGILHWLHGMLLR